MNSVVYAYHFIQWGNPQRPTLICLHGFTGTSNSFTFSNKERNILAIDLIGHGKSDVFVHSYRYTLTSLVTDLSQLVYQLGIDDFYLLGYSMGARTALAWLIEQPRGIRGVIMEGGTPGIESPNERKERQKIDNHLAQKLLTAPLTHFVDYWESLPLFDSQKKLTQSMKKKIRLERLSQQSFGLALSLMYMGTGQQKNYWPFLGNIQVPLLYMVGEYDLKFQVIGAKIVKQNNLFSYLEVPKSGHCIHLEQPEIAESFVCDWMREVEKTDANNENQANSIETSFGKTL
ncbi:MAG: 2-succinyl-6-hydroxy-2,4-cyclohexadiene-1-carboxylate synthase [Enterococcus lacertideformus]|uniref:Putative 2-succinyl-6-hydroxy-2,4-cyclohexadiene-1-carboxylate synthase n=1 Tax=Enterococcus lacertideformus TaxID=2771493 RepID=A0A931AZ64_9ENTE|nr:2-succinyl-6-hydroxy-2,4-cyclohexadiene-1-carboxylate synthase [Enterococcus lacertideformus]